MSNQWKTVVDDDTDNTLRAIKEREDYDSKSQTVNEVLQEGIDSYRTGITAALLDKAALLGAFAAVVAFMLWLASGTPILAKSAVLLGVAGIACSIGAMLDIGVRPLIVPEHDKQPVTDGGDPPDGGDDE